ncbi:MAG: biopolymer transporter ExbD [Nitrospirae bacterium]|nr:biopolymer transporter ExbD [Nitrospirota bacterium]MBI3351568.1 biopolymer transporter ExbD [Nitrospirota bacterium]
MIDREKRKKRRMQTDEAIHIVALWNLMLILIPFLLLSATFSQTSILNLMIPSPSLAAPANKVPEIPPKEPIRLIIKTNSFTLSQGLSWERVIPNQTNRYDYDVLASALRELKERNPKEENITLSSSSRIPYEVIIQAMDQCREAQFSNISLGDDLPAEN